MPQTTNKVKGCFLRESLQQLKMERARLERLTDGVDVRRQRAQRAAAVLLDALRGVQLGDVVVGVDGNQDVGDKRLQEIFTSKLW